MPQSDRLIPTRVPGAPPSKIKLAAALRTLLAQKDFGSITTVAISRQAGVNEALIYRYFRDKRGLLHQVQAEDLEAFLTCVKADLEGIKTPVGKLRKLIWSNIHYYARNRLFAKILLLEVRNFPSYFQSPTYRLVREYGRIVLELVEEGMHSGAIRDDLPAERIRQVILGAIEHLILPAVIFGRKIDTDSLAQSVATVVFRGVLQPQDAGRQSTQQGVGPGPGDQNNTKARQRCKPH
jgi:AcrR family transcriptional regulator